MTHLTDELLNEYLDDVLDSDTRAQAEAHLAACDDCAARLAALRSLFADLDALPDLPLRRDLSASIIRSLRPASHREVSQGGALNGHASMPRSLRLTVVLQAALTVAAIIFAAPFSMQFATARLPAIQIPSFAEVLLQLQIQWASWLDMLSQFELPSMPEIPLIDISSFGFAQALPAVSLLWLVGNGWLLRRQIK